MKTLVTLVTIFVVLLLAISLCFAQDYRSITAVKFRDGSIVQGKILEMNSTTIRILRPDGNIETRNYQDVASFIEGPYSGKQPPPAPSYTPAPPPPYPPPQAYAPQPPRASATYYRAPANYLVFKAGSYSPEADDLRHFDTGFNGEVAFGRYFHPNLALELGAGYFDTEANFHFHDFSGSREKESIWVVPLTLSLKPVVHLYPFDLYAIGGTGLFIIHAKASGNREDTGPFSFSDTANVWGGHLGGGINWNITSNVFIGLESKYTWAEKRFENTVNGTTFQLKADMQGFRTTLNLGFKF